MKKSDRYERGMEIWRKVMAPSADELLANIQSLSPELARLSIEFVFGEIWSRPQLDLKARSLCTIAALTALGRPNQLRFHIQGALNDGAKKEEIQEVMLQMSIYCGFPAAIEALTVAREVFSKK